MFLGHFIELLFCIIFAKDHGHFFFLLSLSLSLFKEDELMPFLNSAFFLSEGAFEEILTLSEVDRHTVEILG